MSTAIKSKIENAMPNSRRIYIDGSHPGVRVPFREITQNVTRNFDNSLEENPPVRVYDTSGPWGDPGVRSDVREGLRALRREWIVGRGDVEEYQGREFKPIDDGYLTSSANSARQKDKGRLEDFPGAASHAAARQARPLCDANALRASRHHHSRDGIHRHP